MAAINRPVYPRAAQTPEQVISCPPDPAESPVMRHHRFGCAAPCRGGSCDCGETVRPTDVRTSSRGFSYELVQMLGDGWWPEEEEA